MAQRGDAEARAARAESRANDLTSAIEEAKHQVGTETLHLRLHCASARHVKVLLWVFPAAPRERRTDVGES